MVGRDCVVVVCRVSAWVWVAFCFPFEGKSSMTCTRAWVHGGDKPWGEKVLLACYYNDND